MKFNDPASILAALVRIPSVSGDEAQAAAWVAEFLLDAGIDVERLGNSVVGRLGTGEPPVLLLHSHLDTVPVGDGWTRDPYEAKWVDGKCYGRGSSDAKASVAAMLWAAAHLAGRRDDGSPPRAGTVLFALTACEETNNSGMSAVLARVGMPDYAVCGEPTGLQVVNAQSGLAVVTARWTGTSCHAAHVASVPNENALLLASRELLQVAPFVELPGEHPWLGRSRAVATQFQSGSRHNVVPGEAEAIFDARLVPPHSGADVQAALQARMPRAHIQIRSDRLRAVSTDSGHPLVKIALSLAGREHPIGSATMSDMALLAGVSAIKCGPGETSRSHAPDEFVLATELQAGARFYQQMVPALFRAVASSLRT
jgi:acetylornithine deacetylase